MRLANYACNRLLALAANLLYGAGITDEATCYKAFNAQLLRGIRLRPQPTTSATSSIGAGAPNR